MVREALDDAEAVIRIRRVGGGAHPGVDALKRQPAWPRIWRAEDRVRVARLRRRPRPLALAVEEGRAGRRHVSGPVERRHRQRRVVVVEVEYHVGAAPRGVEVADVLSPEVALGRERYRLEWQLALCREGEIRDALRAARERFVLIVGRFGVAYHD